MKKLLLRYLYRYTQLATITLSLVYVAFASTSFVLFAQNEAEFHSGFFNVVQHAALPLFGGAMVLAAALALISDGISNVLRALLVGALLLVYLQGTFLVWNYGPFNGEPIDWDAFAAKAILEGAVWIVILAASVLFHKRIIRIQNSVLLFVLLASTIGIVAKAMTGEVRFITPSQTFQAKETFRFSRERNVLEVVLDAFSAPAFDAIMKASPELKDVFRGFTYYQNTLTSFTTTAPSIPSILTGMEYDNSESMKQFLNRAFGDQSLPVVLDRNGVDVTVMSLPQLCSRLKQSCSYLNKVVSTDNKKIEWQDMLELMDLSLFRVVPQVLKRLVYKDQRWLLQKLFSYRGSPASHYNSVRFAEVFERNVSTDAEKPTFKFFHLMLPHAPFVFDAHCQPIEKGTGGRSEKEQYQAQATCALRLVERMIRTLKANGLYDKTMVIIHADHGYSVRYLSYEHAKELPILEQAMPLLLIKQFGGKTEEESVLSMVPARLADIPKTIVDSLGIDENLPGESILKLNSDLTRVRRYRAYGWRNDFWGDAYLPKMQEYEVSGDVRDGASWKRGIKLAPPPK